MWLFALLLAAGELCGQELEPPRRSSRDEILATFRAMEGIVDVSVVEEDYGDGREVVEILFSLPDRPQTLVGLQNGNQFSGRQSKDTLPFVGICQIGTFRIHCATTYRTPPGLSSGIEHSCLYFGDAATLPNFLPMKIQSVDDVVSHYHELAKAFAKWPRKAKPGRLELEDRVIEYWVEEAPLPRPNDP